MNNFLVAMRFIGVQLILTLFIEFIDSSSLAKQCLATNTDNSTFRAGAVAVDISPTSFPVRVAGGFLEGQANKLNDPLFARAVIIDDGAKKIAMVIVDTCMMTQSLIDEAKKAASDSTRIPTDHIMVSATHTHSAPAAMACLGTRQDKAYAASLPGKIADAIVSANDNLQPARIGWASIDDWEHTHNRRWIRKPESKVVDPFGQATGLANMHPGYLSPAVIGPSGPVDPTLSIISLQTRAGKPLAVLANYSQHYFGAGALSSDYYGLFCKHIATLVGESGDGNGPFVAAISQGTSGDLMWMDYGSAAKSITIKRYAEEVAKYAEVALAKVEYHDTVPIHIVEKNITLSYRVPDEKRLAWARPIAAKIEEELPKSQPEVYAMEALILHERQQANVKLQAIRIGDLTIATLPNEVYALTGLKLRGRSPANMHFNIELANGAEGYIPTPEQHTLGGYTTWPARTAGLEVEAEKKIVDTLVDALEQVTGKERRTMMDGNGPYANAILDAKPITYWRMNDEDGNRVRNAVQGSEPAQLSPGFALYLPGVGSGTGAGQGEQLIASEFSGPTQINRAIHFAGGDMSAKVGPLSGNYSFAFWFWLGERSGASERSGQLCIGPFGESVVAKQSADHWVRLQVDDAITSSKWRADEWNFAVIVRENSKLRVHINGKSQPALETTVNTANSPSARLRFGTGLQGKLDEIAVFDRALTSDEIALFWKTSKIAEQLPHSAAQQGNANDLTVAAADAVRSKETPDSPPRSVEESIAKIHVPRGYRVEVVAAEPETVDPVAFDWDAAGRLWVVEMSDYPLGMDGKGKAGGRVRVLEDRDHDGRYETSRLFADELSFPNGILTWRDGVLVTAAPEILFLRDTDGDGIADKREVLFSGFNEGNQQLRMNHLRWGLDNWVYCANGGHHANHGLETRVTSYRKGKSFKLGSRDFRFQPDTGDLQLESGPSQYGRNRDAWGHWFGTQNANPLWQYVLSDRYLARNPHVPTPSPIKHIVGPGSPVVYPASQLEKRFHSFEQSGRFTSACSGMIYNDELLFGRNVLTHAFTCEPFHNLVQHNVLSDDGVSFKARRPVGEGQLDFFASEDRWCRPVMVRTGPDGGLWVADMYRYMIEHPDWLPPQGKAELLPHYRLGDDRGRIYRVVPAAASVERTVALDHADTAQLVASLDSANDWQRDKVHQMLLWKNDPVAIPMLQKAATQSNFPQARVQALCVLDGLNALSSTNIVNALQDVHPRVRGNAVRLAERYESPEIVEAVSKLANDADEKVCLQLALSLGDWKTPIASKVLAELAVRFAGEPYVVSAIM
ncbi:MAG: neutral/alkaline non-lysosomal ceramidase N-terminal domain-containing protein, partial [Pirellula sp.]